MANIYGTSGNNDLDGTTGDDKIYGYGGSDELSGGAGNDVLYGGGGSDVLYGGDGDDQLSGGEGADYMEGGNGNDTYFVDDKDDQVIELSNGGTDTVVSSLKNYRIGDNIEVLIMQNGAGDINGTGNNFANSIRGNEGKNELQGLGGNDSIYGFAGDDIINGGSGDDLLDGGDGTDILSYKVGATGGVTVSLAITTVRQNTGSAGNDFIRNFESLEGTQFDDVLTGNAGANTISALGGNDTIRGGAGNDQIIAGTGDDKILFESAATNGLDRIRDFSQGHDKLVFNTTDGYDAGATLSYDTASGTGAQFIYDTKTSILSYDADGTGAGAAIQIANLLESPKLMLLQSDIVIM